MKGKSYLRFRRLARWYDGGFRTLGVVLGGERAVRGKILDLLPLTEGDRVLDLGCGTGTVSLMAAGRVGSSGTVVGVDPSAEMLEQAERKLSEAALSNVSFRCGAAPLSFADASFDAVILFLALHEMAHEDRVETLQETVRLLRPGGHLLVAELSPPARLLPRLLLRLLLTVEEEEATDFLRRGLEEVMTEGAANTLVEVKRITLPSGLACGVLYVKR